MPAKGTKYKSGKRDLIYDGKFYNELRKITGIELTDKEIRHVIITSNEEIAKTVAEHDEGFKLPESLGYIAVTKYKSKKRAIDWVNSKKLKRKIYLTNLHSFGYIHHIKWYKKGSSNVALIDAYILEPCRLLKRDVASKVKAHKIYHTWSNSDFWNQNKIIRKLYNR